MKFSVEEACLFPAISQWQTSSREFQTRTSLEVSEFFLAVRSLYMVNSRGDLDSVTAFLVILLTH